MQFEYEISVDQSVSAHLLYHKMGDSRTRVKNRIYWMLGGIILIAVAWSERSANWSPALLAMIGAWWIYGVLVSIFPARYFRKAYPKSMLAGKKFKADVGEDGFEVVGDTCTWRVQWPGVSVKGENERVFVFSSYGTLFIFGKEYLSSEQQRELRRVSGLKEG